MKAETRYVLYARVSKERGPQNPENQLRQRSRWRKLLPEGADIGKAINDAMKAFEAEDADLKDVAAENV